MNKIKEKLWAYIPIMMPILLILAVAVILFVCLSVGVEGYSLTQPFVFDPDDIAVNQSGVYVMDDGRNKICAFDLEGNFLYTISFDEGSGVDYVYVNESGNVCRIRERGDVLYEFDKDGHQINKTTLQNGLPKHRFQTYAQWDNIQVQLEKKPFHLNRVVVNNACGEVITFPVQNTGWYLLKTGIILLVIATFILALIVALKIERKQKNKSCNKGRIA